MKKKSKLFWFVFVFLLIGLVSSEELRVTQEHPFFVDGKWIPASALNVGDELITSSGQKVKIISIEDVSEPVEVYNLHVGWPNTFFVNDVLVHNKPVKNNLINEFETSYEKYSVNKLQYEHDLETWKDFDGNEYPPYLSKVDENGRRYFIDYEEKFNDLIQSRPGSIIEVTSHIKNGRLNNYGRPAQGVYQWIIDIDGNFIVTGAGYRCSLKLEAVPKINHATLARGREIYGGGEILFVNGEIKEFNSLTGHYYPDLTGNPGLRYLFNCQNERVFKSLANDIGLKEVEGGAEFSDDFLSQGTLSSSAAASR